MIGRWIIRWSVGVACLAIAAPLPGCNEPDVVQHRPDPVDVEEGDDAELTALAFDPSTSSRVRGRVAEVEPFQRMRGTRQGIRVRMVADDGTYYVYLGPRGYLVDHGLELQRDDAIEVDGSVLSGDGRRVIIATRIVHGDTAVELRDDEGRPMWRRWRLLPHT